MKQPVDHVLRPQLPWRAAIGITECGLDGSKVGVLTRDQFFQRVKDMGSQRAAMITCMTCSQTVRNYKTWEEDPRSAMGREIAWENGWSRDDRGQQLRDELEAVAALIEAHREEFDAHVAHTQQRRDWLEQKKARAKRPPPPPSSGGLL